MLMNMSPVKAPMSLYELPFSTKSCGAVSASRGGRASQRTMGLGEGESVGFPGCLVIAINLITSRSPRPPLSLPKASAGFAADSHMA